MTPFERITKRAAKNNMNEKNYFCPNEQSIAYPEGSAQLLCWLTEKQENSYCLEGMNLWYPNMHITHACYFPIQSSSLPHFFLERILSSNWIRMLCFLLNKNNNKKSCKLIQIEGKIQIPHTETKSLELMLFFKYATVFYSQALSILLNCLMLH